VEGCVAELHPDEEGRNYNYRYRLCEPHMRASAVPFQGQQQRFCQARAAPRRCLARRRVWF